MYQEDTVVMTTKFNKTYTPGFIRHFLTKQMEKALSDIEELKDANREIHYKNGAQ